MNIFTHRDPKPIPDRRFDWSAWVGGDESLCASGPTEQHAIEALNELIAEIENEQCSPPHYW